MASTWITILLVVALVLRTRASVISKGQLQSCDSYVDGLRNCGKKLLVEYVIGVGQNSTDTISATIGEITDTTTKAKGTLGNKQIGITFSKTAIYFYYTTYYKKTVNYQPWEQKSFGTGSGAHFIPFNANILNGQIHICKDGDQEEEAVCGWVVVDGQKVSGSQGKCCECYFNEMVGGDTYSNRGGAECNIMGHKTQSAHCLRMDPLYYHIYSVGGLSYWYQITMTIRSCPNTNGKAAAEKDCKISKALTLDPGHTMVFDGATPAESSVQATLIGDYSSFQKAPTFENKYLAVPAGTSESDCNGKKDPSRPSLDLKARCAARIKEGMEKWMLVDQNLFGDKCNKIGVTYESFRYQSHFCDRSFGSCTRQQLADYYDYDQKQANEGKTGMYWLSNMGHQGLLDFEVENGQTHELANGKNSNVRLMFKSNRFQNTLIALQIKAEDITLTTNVANGKIVKWEIPTFENGSNDGQIKINIKNTDPRNVYAQFILSVEQCDNGIKTATQAGQAIRSLTGGQEMTIPINVIADARIESDHTNDHVCTARLFNAAGEEIDSQQMTFKTTETKLIVQNNCEDAGSSCGDAATGGESTGLNAVCTCHVFEFPCFVRGISIFNIGDTFSRCAAVIGTTIAIIVIIIVALIILCLSFKFLGVKKTCQVLCCPLICLCKCFKCGVDICLDDKDEGRSSRYYSEDSPPRRKKRSKKNRRKKKKHSSSHSKELLTSSEESYHSTGSDNDSDSDSDGAVAPQRTSKYDAPPQRRREIPLAVLAGNDDEDEDDLHAYVSYFDNKTTTVFFNIEGDANKTHICDMEGEDFSIRGVLIGEDGTFTFTVPSKDRYVRKEMFNGELLELEEPRQLHDQISEITLTASEVYDHISKDMRAIAINV